MIESVIYISLALSGDQPLQTQLMDGTPVEKANISVAEIVALVTFATSLLGHVGFRSYLYCKMGNQSNELFSNKSVLTMCMIYAIMMVLVPVAAFYLQQPDLVGVVKILGTSLVLPTQILVCHDNAYNFFLARHPKVKALIDSLKGGCEPVDDDSSTSDDVEMPSYPHIFTISEMVERSNNQAINPDPLEAWRLPRNRPQVLPQPLLIHVKPVSDVDE